MSEQNDELVLPEPPKRPQDHFIENWNAYRDSWQKYFQARAIVLQKAHDIRLSREQAVQWAALVFKHDQEYQETWMEHWRALAIPWRAAPEISLERQHLLSERLQQIQPDINLSLYPFKDVKLSRGDIEWLLVNHDDGRGYVGPVDWDDPEQHIREGLDLRGADLQDADLRGLPLARVRCGLSSLEGAISPGTPRTRSQDDPLGLGFEVRRAAGAKLDRANLSGAYLQGADFNDAHMDDVLLSGASIQEANLRNASMQRAQLGDAHAEAADFGAANLQGAVLTYTHMELCRLGLAQMQGAALLGTHLEGAHFLRANLEGALIPSASIGLGSQNSTAQDHSPEVHMEGSDLRQARLTRADLHGAHLEGCDLRQAHLEGADLHGVHLEGRRVDVADLKRINGLSSESLARRPLPDTLPPADLRRALLDAETILDGVVLTKGSESGPRLADVRWGGANLSVVNWSQVIELGDEKAALGWRPPKGSTRDDIPLAPGAFTTLVFGTSAEPPNKSKVSDISTPSGAKNASTSRKQRDARRKLAKRRQAEERLELFQEAVRANRQLSVALQSEGLSEDAARFAYHAQVLQRSVYLQQRQFGRYFLSSFLNTLAGYGYRPLNSLRAYLITIAVFSIIYYVLGQVVGPSFSMLGAAIFSVTSFHGRGFFPGGIVLDDPITALAAVEAFVGLVIEATFIATFTQRLFSMK